MRRLPITAAKATDLIRERAADSSRVSLTLHAQAQMLARDIIAPEVFRILREGIVHEPPLVVADGWKAVMELRLPGGAEAAAVTVVADSGGVRVVTVMWKDPP